jgi:hypothetical protein
MDPPVSVFEPLFNDSGEKVLYYVNFRTGESTFSPQILQQLHTQRHSAPRKQKVTVKHEEQVEDDSFDYDEYFDDDEIEPIARRLRRRGFNSDSEENSFENEDERESALSDEDGTPSKDPPIASRLRVREFTEQEMMAKRRRKLMQQRRQRKRSEESSPNTSVKLKQLEDLFTEFKRLFDFVPNSLSSAVSYLVELNGPLSPEEKSLKLSKTCEKSPHRQGILHLLIWKRRARDQRIFQENLYSKYEDEEGIFYVDVCLKRSSGKDKKNWSMKNSQKGVIVRGKRMPILLAAWRKGTIESDNPRYHEFDLVEDAAQIFNLGLELQRLR